MPSSEQVLKGVLFEALNQGYVSGNKPETLFIEDLYYKRFIYYSPCGHFTVEDRWISTGGDYSAGSTLIVEDHRPVWVMQYHGWYVKEAGAFLKRVLARNYRDRVFNGGRGRPTFTDGQLQYTNVVESGSSFGSFGGQEKVVDCRNRVALGEHRYHGGMLENE